VERVIDNAWSLDVETDEPARRKAWWRFGNTA
jgi:hypothetical protein